jgi:serine/threonine-protein kinase HipA
MIAPKLTYLNDLPYTAVELRQEAANRAKKAIHSGCTTKA